MELYEYRPLRPGEIRVFHMDSSASIDGPITGTLRTRYLGSPYVKGARGSQGFMSLTAPLHAPVARQPDEFIPFTTLSHAWGQTHEDNSHLTDHIICNGKTLRVTSNLKQALLNAYEAPMSREAYKCCIALDRASHVSNG